MVMADPNATTGHLARACPERQSDPGVSERPGQDGAEPAGVVPPAAAVRPAAEGPGAAAAPDLTESDPQAQPAAQTPTGATSAPEKPRTAEPARQSHARLDRPGRSRGLLENLSGFWSSAGAACTDRVRCRGAGQPQGKPPDTTPVQGDGGDVDMADEPVFKVPNKRKKKGAREGQTEQVEAAGPKMSYRGRTLVINNLAASSLWHKLACVDPPPNLLATSRPSWWTSSGRSTLDSTEVLHLPKEEGGQGLVQLLADAAFRLQFIRDSSLDQSFVWRQQPWIITTVKGLGLDRALFLMDTKMLDISGLPMFYRGLF
ncbi:hypothetical protein QTP86_013064 [Hemibagrus guttatus]|nr:hypothetical protein QTP86_013064 [Hemibagrus guttatus]